MFKRKIADYLIKWKNKKPGERKPLIVRGARQVGKTSAILMFGKKHFKRIVYLNLENTEHLNLFKGEVTLKDFERIIRVKFNQKIIPSETLIFIDEIQNSPSLIKLLRFFYEEKPELHIVAAGSLLESKIKKEGLSLPVGRIEYIYLHPLDFFEYLNAKKENSLLRFLKHFSLGSQLPLGIHEYALRLFHEYAMVGGMPEIVNLFLKGNDLQDLKSVYTSLFTSYSEDVYKYTSLAKAKYLTHVIETAPLFAGTTITYEKFGGSNFRSREMSEAFEALEKAMLIYQVQATKSTKLPLIPQRKMSKKLLFLDIGLVNHQMGIQEAYLKIKNLDGFYRGRMAEQIVGQNILAQFMHSPAKIFYWVKEKSKGSAEVDFCLNKKGKIIGIEVKSGTKGRLKSLCEFAKLTEGSQLFRIHSGKPMQEDFKVGNKNVRLISLPFYLTPRILDLD